MLISMHLVLTDKEKIIINSLFNMAMQTSIGNVAIKYSPDERLENNFLATRKVILIGNRTYLQFSDKR